MAEVKALRDRGYEFYAGCEVDYNKKAEKEILEHLEKHKYAFVMCSIHMVEGLSISNRTYVPSINDLNKLLDIIAKYYEEFKWSLGVEAFEVIGHVSVFKRYLREAFLNSDAMKRLVNEAEHEIARISAQSGKILEINSSGLFSPLGAPLPDRSFLAMYHEFGGRLVCAGSDAHNMADAGRGMAEVHDILREAGFKYVALPWDREHPVTL
jgi:Histidinol phosphatase and related hydrolases of the PHP family